jgi:hypothetical protein
MRESVEQSPHNNPVVALTKSDLYSEDQIKEYCNKFITEASKWVKKQCKLTSRRLAKLKRDGKPNEHTDLIFDRYNNIKEELDRSKKEVNSKMIFVISCKLFKNVNKIKQQIISYSEANKKKLSPSAIKLFNRFGKLGLRLSTAGIKFEKDHLGSAHPYSGHKISDAKNHLQQSKICTFLPFIPFEKALEALKEIKGCDVTSDDLIVDLKELHERGLIIFFSDNPHLQNFVFTDIALLTDVMKMLFSHEEETRFSYEELDDQLKEYPYEVSQHSEYKSMLDKKGFMSYVFIKS